MAAVAEIDEVHHVRTGPKDVVATVIVRRPKGQTRWEVVVFIPGEGFAVAFDTAERQRARQEGRDITRQLRKELYR